MTVKWATLGLLLVLVASFAWLVNGRSETAVRLDYELLSWLRSRATVVALPIRKIGKIGLFLNPDDPVVTKLIVRWQTWEPNETRWFVDSVRPGDTVVDIGANIGYYTVIAGKLVGDAGRVYAFEPDPVAFELLLRNVALNGLHNVVAEQKAVSNENGAIRLYLSDENKGDHRIFETKGEERESIEVEAVRLDDYFADYTGHIGFLKIDTQGAEGAIVEGMGGLLERHPEAVLAIEFFPSALTSFGYDAKQLLETFQTQGFGFYDLGTWRPQPLRSVRPEELLVQHTVENGGYTNLYTTRGRLPAGAAP